MLAQPGQVLVDVGRVEDDEEVVGRAAVDDAVVDDAAARQAHDGVERRAVAERGGVVGDERCTAPGRAGAAKPRLAHVADVEEAGALAHGGVLVR